MSSWFKKNSLGKKVSSLKLTSNEEVDEELNGKQIIDCKAALDSFKNHWLQAYQIMRIKTIPSSFGPNIHESAIINRDDITIIVNHIDSMIELLLQESQGLTKSSSENDIQSHNSSPIMMSPLLDYLLMESILEKIFNWSCNIGEFTEIMKLEQLKFYELLLNQLCHESALFQKPLVCPLLQLLSTCGDCAHVEVEKSLVVLLNTLCIYISQNPSFIELFFNIQNQQENNIVYTVNEVKFSPQFRSKLNYLNKPESKFLIFSLLIPFVHREENIGQQARHGILLILSLSYSNDSLAHYITDCTSFCPVLATGLSGLYSSLPRKLKNIISETNNWYRNFQNCPEVEMFLNSLEFCNEVVKISHPLVKKQLCEYVYQGFLVSVIGPALHQDTLNVPLDFLEKSSKYSNTIEEIIGATTYLELCLRTITEPALLQVFLKFICLEKFDDQRILYTLISRIQANSQLSLITLTLFRTMLDMNCEDVMIELVLKYLMTGRYLCDDKEKQFEQIDDTSFFHQTSKKLLTLTPNFISTNLNAFNSNDLNSSISETDLDSNTSSYFSIFENYLNYLNDAHFSVKNCLFATKSWSRKYDSKVFGLSNNFNFSPNDSGIYIVNNSQVPSSSPHPSQKFEIDSNLDLISNESEIIGPFLSNLFSRLKQMPFNDFYINLQLTGLISRLATFSQPILKSFLLNDNLILHKNVRSLLNILIEIKQDMEEIPFESFDDLYQEAKIFFNLKEELSFFKEDKTKFLQESDLNKKSNSLVNLLKDNKQRRSIKSILFGISSNKLTNSNKTDSRRPSLESINTGYRYINKKYSLNCDENTEEREKVFQNRHKVLAVIIFNEFIKELSAISQEHFISIEKNCQQKNITENTFSLENKNEIE